MLVGSVPHTDVSGLYIYFFKPAEAKRNCLTEIVCSKKHHTVNTIVSQLTQADHMLCTPSMKLMGDCYNEVKYQSS